MAVIKDTIKQAIIDMQDQLKTQTDSDQAIQLSAELLATIIVNAILSADVQPGIPVATTGSSSAQTGATTSTGSLK